MSFVLPTGTQVKLGKSSFALSPTITTLTSGGFVATWSEGGYVNGKAQIFDAAGQPIGAVFAANGGFRSSVTALPDGGFVMAYMVAPITSASKGIGIQIYNAAGKAVGAEIIAATSTSAVLYKPAIISLAGGGFVVTWEDGKGSTDAKPIFKAQVYAADGAEVGDLITFGEPYGAQSVPSVSSFANGGFVIAWEDTSSKLADHSKNGINAQIFAADGSKVGTEFLVNTQTSGFQWEVDTVTLSNGNFVAVWADLGAVSGTGAQQIKAQLFSPAGVRIGTEILVGRDASFSQRLPQVVAILDGGFLVSWADHDSNANQVAKAQAFDSSGNKFGLDVLIAPSVRGYATGTQMAALPDGTIVAAYTDNSYSSSKTVQFQLLTPGHAVQFATFAGVADVSTSTVENKLEVTTVRAVSSDPALNIRYALSGADAKLFSINAAGELNFRVRPDFEAPRDAGHNNTYDVTVIASDGVMRSSQIFAVKVYDVTDENIVGTASADVLTGAEGRDVITGLAGRDTLDGQAGNDHLYGGAGADILIGGADDDVLVGGLGRDVLTGGAGFDAFFFDVKETASAKDTITDFVHGTDSIALSSTAFVAVADAHDFLRFLLPSAFIAGTAATTADQHLIYNRFTGVLSYDADGSGAQHAVAIAILTNKPELVAGDIVVF